VQHLHHVFLVVTPPGGGAPCIADPTFRSNFQLSDMHTTAAYAAALPSCELPLLAPWTAGATKTVCVCLVTRQHAAFYASRHCAGALLTVAF
jgi:hypothetical protein